MSSPTSAVRDFAAAMRGDSKRDRVLGLTLAVLITIIIIIVFFVDARINTAGPPKVVFVQTYAPDRNDAQIIADQKRDAAALKAAKAEKRRQFKQLEKQLGME